MIRNYTRIEPCWFPRKWRTALNKAIQNCPTGWDLTLYVSDYIGGHPEQGHTGELLILAHEKGVTTDPKWWTTHGTFSYPLENLMELPEPVLIWWRARKSWVPRDGAATMTSYRPEEGMPALYDLYETDYREGSVTVWADGWISFKR